MRAAMLALALAAFAAAEPPRPWLRLSTPHFEMLTTASERDARACLDHLERVRRFFATQPAAVGGGAVRVIAFGSPSEYAPYQLHDHTDAYYVGSAGRDYIVMASLGDAQLSAAAHEYAHLIARHQGLALPVWLAEGLAEVFSTVRFEADGAVVGAPPRARLQRLRAERWLPLADLFAARDTASFSRQEDSLFYAESWALTHMLMFSPAYSSHFGALLAGKSPIEPSAELERDLRAWVNTREWPSMQLPLGGGAPEPPITVEDVAPFDVQFALADLLAASGRDDRARAAWLELEASHPKNAEIQAALARIALARGQSTEARARYQRAMALGIRDARLCADYAGLAEDAGLPEGEVRAAYERALELDPAMDDAHYHLGLLDMQAGRYQDALTQLQALRQVPEGRAFGYYVALANCQLELGRREDAARAAAEALQHAHTDEERTAADDLAWMATTELAVQLAPNGQGRLRRVPIGERETSNPFIAPGDRVERREGVLERVDCGKELRLTVRLASGTVVLSIPDPSRVRVRKAGGGSFEFTCGAQQGQPVLVEYAASDPKSGVAGVLRGIELR